MCELLAMFAGSIICGAAFGLTCLGLGFVGNAAYRLVCAEIAEHNPYNYVEDELETIMRWRRQVALMGHMEGAAN